MGHTHDAITQHLAERWCWQVARRDEARIARRLSRQPLVEGVYRLDDGAVVEDFCHCLDQVGVKVLRAEVRGAARHREMLPVVPQVLRDGLKTLVGLERLHALPAWLCSAEALMPWVGLHAQQVCAGVCRRGTTTRQGARALGPIGPDTLAKPMVQGDVRPLEAVCHRARRALGQAGVFGQQVTGMADGTDGATTARDAGCGRATRTRRIADTRGQGHESAVTVYGWQVLRWMEAAPKRPLAVQGGQIQAREPPWTRALVTQARAHGAGAARLATVVVAQGGWEGSARWWLDQPGIRCVVPAKANLAVTADARAQAAAGERLPVGERVHPVRHGPGQGARTARLETEVVGITGLTTDDQSGTVEPGRDASRRDVAANPLNAVVVRQWHGRDDGPGGNTVFRTHAAVDTPWPPCDDDDERRLSDNCGMQAAKPPWDLGQPPQKTARAVRVPVLFTLLLVAWATASRWPCEREAVGGEPVGQQRWRRQLLEHTRDQVMVLAQGYDGSFHRADYALRLGVQLQDKPPGIGTYHDMRAKDRLTSQA